MTSLLDTSDNVVNNERRRLLVAPGVGNGATGVYDDAANADAKLTAEADDDDFNPRPSPRPNPNAIALTAHTVITITRCFFSIIIPLEQLRNHHASARATPSSAPNPERNDNTRTRTRRSIDRSRRGSADHVERVAVWPTHRATVRGPKQLRKAYRTLTNHNQTQYNGVHTHKPTQI
jgi:hypothetical protein